MTAPAHLPMRLPVPVDALEVSEQIVMTFPRSALSGTQLGRFTERHWNIYFQLFMRIVQEVVFSPESVAVLHIEGLSTSDGEIVAYRFFLTLTGSDGTVLNNLGARFANDRQYTLALAREGDKPASDFLRRAGRGALLPYEQWRSVDSVRTWGDVVEECTGMAHDNATDLTGWAFAPEVAFAVAPISVSAGQGAAAYSRYYDTAADLVTTIFRFPAAMRNYAYTVPADLCSVIAMDGRLDPVHQINFARRELGMALIPVITGDKPPCDMADNGGGGDDDEDGNSDAAVHKRARLALMQSIGATDSVHRREVRGGIMRGTDATQAEGAEDPTDIFGITPFDEMGATAKNTRASIRRQADATRVLLPAGQAAAAVAAGQPAAAAGQAAAPPLLYARQLITGCGRLTPATQDDRAWMVTQRRLNRFLQDGLAAMFESVFWSSPKTSPSGVLITDYARKTNLMSLDATAWYMKQRVGSMSLGNYFIAKSLVVYELIFKVNTLHAICAAAEEYSLDSYRYGTDLHLNLLLLSDMGATGKSAVFEILKLLRIPATVEAVTYVTAAAMAIDGDINGNRNFGDFIRFFDELPPVLMGCGNDKITEQESRMKAIMSTCISFYKSLKFLDNGDRAPTGTATLWPGTFFGGANLPGEGHVSHSMLSRWDKRQLSEVPDANARRVEQMMMEEARDEAAASPLMDRLRKVSYQNQFFHYMVEKAIHAGVIANVSSHGMVLFLSAFINRMVKEGLKSGANARTWLRVQRLARVKCIKTAWLKLMADRHAGVPGSAAEINTDSIIGIEPMLYVTVEQTVSAISDLSGEIYPPLPYAIRRCIRALYDSKIGEVRARVGELPPQAKANHRDLFSREGASETDNEQRNFAYFTVRKNDLVQHILATVKGYMGGFQPSRSVCLAALTAMSMVSLRSRPYTQRLVACGVPVGRHPDAVPVDCAPKQDALVMRTREGRVMGSTELEFHMKWIRATDTGSGGNVKMHSDGRIGNIIRDMLSTRHQLPRTVAFGQSSGTPEKVPCLETQRARDIIQLDANGERPLFTCATWTRTDNDNNALLPEYQSDVNAFGGGGTVLHTDIDTYALAAHLDVLGRCPFNVESGFDGRVSALLAGHGDGHHHFFGATVDQISPDVVEGLMGNNLAALRASAAAEGAVDGDFDRAHYMVKDALGTPVGHWTLVKANFTAADFGFEKWADDEETLVRQYRMHCAFHPIIITDRYMTPTERASAKAKRDVLDAPPAPRAPLVVDQQQQPVGPGAPGSIGNDDAAMRAIGLSEEEIADVMLIG